MKFKVIEQAKENWNSLQEQQKAYIFQAVWFGKLVPGMTSKEEAKAKGIIANLKKRIGKFPGLLYAEAYSVIEDYKVGKVSKDEVVKVLSRFYPVNSRIGLRVTPEEIELNKQVQLKLNNLSFEYLDEILLDLQESESRDKIKVLKTI